MVGSLVVPRRAVDEYIVVELEVLVVVGSFTRGVLVVDAVVVEPELAELTVVAVCGDDAVEVGADERAIVVTEAATEPVPVVSVADDVVPGVVACGLGASVAVAVVTDAMLVVVERVVAVRDAVLESNALLDVVS
jgi:hypothetical protein